jgi:4-amino-4-deoxy-L-arabinose transferase-like glycosyltransferase
LFPAIAQRAGDAPLDYLGIRLVTSLVGHGTTATRAWSWACGVAAIVALAWLSWEIWRSRIVSLFAALLLSLSAFHILYSQEARFYALAVLAGTVSMASFLAARRTGRRTIWGLFGVSVALALLSHYFLVVVPVSIGLAMLPPARSFKSRTAVLAVLRDRLPVMVSVGIGFAIFLPWLLFAAAAQAGRHFPYQPPVFFDLQRYDDAILSVLAPAPHAATPPYASYVFARSIEALAIVGLVSPIRDRVGVNAAAIAGVLILPVAFLADITTGYFFASRQIIFFLVPLYCLAARGCLTLAAFVGRVTRPAGRMAAVGALGAVIVAGSFAPIASVIGNDRSKENWRAVADVVAAGLCPGGRILVDIGSGYLYGVGYYHPELLPSIVKINPRGSDRAAVVEALREVEVSGRDWVVLRGSATTGDQINQALLWLAKAGHHYDWQYKLALVTPPQRCDANPTPQPSSSAASASASRIE